MYVEKLQKIDTVREERNKILSQHTSQRERFCSESKSSDQNSTIKVSLPVFSDRKNCPQDRHQKVFCTPQMARRKTFFEERSKQFENQRLMRQEMQNQNLQRIKRKDAYKALQHLAKETLAADRVRE